MVKEEGGTVTAAALVLQEEEVKVLLTVAVAAVVVVLWQQEASWHLIASCVGKARQYACQMDGSASASEAQVKITRYSCMALMRHRSRAGAIEWQGLILTDVS